MARAHRRRQQDRARRSGASSPRSTRRRTWPPPRDAGRSRRVQDRRPARTSRAFSSRPPTTSPRTRPRSSSSTTSSRRSSAPGPGRHGLRAFEEPDAVRRAHHRLDDREGGAGAAGARARRRGHLQPAARRACRSGSTRRIRYGYDIPPTQAILESQLESDHPYNTRKRPGLPPTPISNPGLASMQAAAHPAEVDYLYFVRKPDCKSHFFTASHAEFLELHPRKGCRC